MDKVSVITNNKMVAEFYSHAKDKLEVRFVGAPGLEILATAKAQANGGFVLLSNPLSGVKRTSPLFSPKTTPVPKTAPKQKIVQLNPYLSLLMMGPGEMIDFRTVREVEEAIQLYKKNARLRHVAHSDESVRAFMQADLEVIREAMAKLSHQ
jgi:hypothetical protein